MNNALGLSEGITFELPCLADASGGPVRASVASQLMESWESGSPVGNEKELQLVRDSENNIRLFSVQDGALRVLVKRSATTTGWERETLTPAAGASVVAYAVHAAADGTISAAAAMNDGTLYFTTRVEDRAADTRWRACGDLAGLEPSKLQIIGGDGMKIFIVAKRKGRRATTFIAAAKDGRPVPEEWQIPATFDEVDDIRVSGNYVYVLYSYKGTHRVCIIDVNDPHYKRDIPCAANPTAMEIVDADGDATLPDLYVASAPKGQPASLWRLTAEEQSIAVASDDDEPAGTMIATKLNPITRIFAARDEKQAVSLYAVTNDGLLLHTARESPARLENPTWSRMSVLQRGLTSASPVRSASPRVNEVLLASGGGMQSYSYLWQDRRTTLWHRDAARFPSGEVRRINTASTQVAFKAPVSETEAKVTIQASECATVSSNGRTYFLDAGKRIDVPLGPDHRLTIVNRLGTLNSPLLRIESNLFEQALEIEPLRNVRDKLRDMTPEQLAAAKGHDGRPIVEDGLRDPKTLQNVTTAMNQIAALERRRSAMVLDTGNAGVTVVDRTEAFDATIDFNALGDDYAWCVDFDNDGPRLLDAMATRERIVPDLERRLAAQGAAAMYGETGIAADDDYSIGNLLASLLNFGERLLKVAIKKVGEALDCFIEIGNRVWKAVVTTVEQAFEALHYILTSYLGLDLDRLVQWLGFIFDWNDVLSTHDYLCQYVADGIEFSRGQMQVVKKQVEASLASFSDAIRKYRQAPAEVKTTVPASAPSSIESRLTTPEQRQKRAQTETTLETNPAANWGIHQLTSALPAGLPILELTPVSAPLAAGFERFQAKAKQFGDRTAKDLEHLWERLEAAAQDGNVTTDALVSPIMEMLLAGGIDVTKDISTTLFEIADDTLGYFADLLTKRIDIPVLTNLYEHVIAKGRPFTLLSALMLPASIPVTFASKLLTGKLPFAGVERFRFRPLTESAVALAGETDDALRILELVAGGWVNWVLATIQRVVSTVARGSAIIEDNLIGLAAAILTVILTLVRWLCSYPATFWGSTKRFPREPWLLMAGWGVTGFSALVGLVEVGVNGTLRDPFSSSVVSIVSACIRVVLQFIAQTWLFVERCVAFATDPTKLVQPVLLYVQLVLGWYATMVGATGLALRANKKVQLIAMAAASDAESKALAISLGRNVLASLTSLHIVTV